MSVVLEWEEIDDRTYRASVPGGWVLKVCYPVYNPGEFADYEYRPAMVFVPDPDHTWGAEEKP